MKVNDVALITNSSVKVETSLRAFGFVITAGNAANYAAFVSAYAGCTVEIIKQTPNGAIQIVPVRKLTDVLEVFAADTGAIMVTSNGTATTVRAQIELSDMGALSLESNEYYKLNFVGIPATHTVDVYAVDAQVDAQGWQNVLEIVTVDANTPKSILVPQTKMLALPVATITRLELKFVNGRVCVFEAEELKLFSYETNEIAVNENGVATGGFRDFYVVNIADAVSAKVTCSAATTILKIDFKQA